MVAIHYPSTLEKRKILKPLKHERLITRPYPKTKRSEWQVKWIVEPYWNSDTWFWEFEYAVYENLEQLLFGKPFLLNNHKAQRREWHCRIKGIDTGNLIPASNPKPFPFPNYWGEVEYLDGTYERELHFIAIMPQLVECIEKFLYRAEKNRYFGDRRGTTLNLQVGASAHDGRWGGFSSYSSSSATLQAGWGDWASGDLSSWYYFESGTTIGGTSIDDVSFGPKNYADNPGSPDTTIHLNDVESPSTPTSKADGDSKARTTAYIDPDGATYTPGSRQDFDLSGSLQEVVDAYDPENFMVIWWSTMSSSGYHYRSMYAYDSSSSDAATMDADYSLGVTEVGLSGNRPGASGSIGVEADITLAGNKPQPTGDVISLEYVDVAGSKPEASGEVLQQVTLLDTLAGSKDEPSGELVWEYHITLAGNKPAPSGLLSIVGDITLAGEKPDPSGEVSSSEYYEVTGNKPSPSGVVTIQYQIELLGSRNPAQGDIGYSTSGEITFVNQTSGTSTTMTEPTGVQEGDILIAILYSVSTAPSGLTGWTQVGSTLSGFFDRTNVWWIKRGSSAPDLTWAGGSSPNYQLLAFRGCDQVSPLDVGNSGTYGTLVAPSVTANEDDSMLVCLTGRYTTNPSAPGSMTEVAASANNFTSGYEQLSSGGATGTRTFTGGSGDILGSFTVALRTATGVIEQGLSGIKGAPSGEVVGFQIDTAELTGSKDEPSGDLEVIQGVVVLAGSKDAATGELDTYADITITGNKPGPSGVAVVSTDVLLEGEKPSPTGTIALIGYIILSGVKDAPSGELLTLQTLLVTLAGNRGAPSGTVVATFVRALSMIAHYGGASMLVAEYVSSVVKPAHYQSALIGVGEYVSSLEKLTHQADSISILSED